MICETSFHGSCMI